MRRASLIRLFLIALALVDIRTLRSAGDCDAFGQRFQAPVPQFDGDPVFKVSGEDGIRVILFEMIGDYRLVASGYGSGIDSAGELVLVGHDLYNVVPQDLRNRTAVLESISMMKDKVAYVFEHGGSGVFFFRDQSWLSAVHNDDELDKSIDGVGTASLGRHFPGANEVAGLAILLEVARLASDGRFGASLEDTPTTGSTSSPELRVGGVAVDEVYFHRFVELVRKTITRYPGLPVARTLARLSEGLRSRSDHDRGVGQTSNRISRQAGLADAHPRLHSRCHDRDRQSPVHECGWTDGPPVEPNELEAALVKQRKLSLWIEMIIGLAVLAVLAFALFRQRRTRKSPCTTRVMRSWTENAALHFERVRFAASEAFVFGSDDHGRDAWSLIVYGIRFTMLLGRLIVLGRLVFALPLALTAGFGRLYDYSTA